MTTHRQQLSPFALILGCALLGCGGMEEPPASQPNPSTFSVPHRSERRAQDAGPQDCGRGGICAIKTYSLLHAPANTVLLDPPPQPAAKAATAMQTGSDAPLHSGATASLRTLTVVFAADAEKATAPGLSDNAEDYSWGKDTNEQAAPLAPAAVSGQGQDTEETPSAYHGQILQKDSGPEDCGGPGHAICN